MSALGLAIMIVAGVVTLDVILENTRNTDASIVGQTISNVDLGGFFTAGVLVGVALMLGVMLLLAGLRRANRKRQERKELERSYAGTATQAESLQEERDRLAAELEQERQARRMAEHPGGGQLTGVGAPVTGSSATGAPTAGASDARATSAPVYPSEPAGAGTGAGAPAATSTATSTGAASTGATVRTDGEHTKPTLKQRLLGS